VGVVLHLSEEENVTLSASVAKRLIDNGNGDACLLYLCLKVNKDAMEEEKLKASLKWDALRFDHAKQVLAKAGLISLPEKKEIKEPKEPRGLPEYNSEDIANKIEDDKLFAALLCEVERKLGKLSVPELGKLLGLNKELGLPCEVIYLLANYCIERKERQLGKGHMPTMREVEKEGYVWARKELLTTERANEYLKKQEKLRASFPDYMRALQIEGRTLVPSEEAFLSEWAAMGFPQEAVALAYDKTVLNCHEFKWKYCNGILEKWHSLNLHTLAEVQNEKEYLKGKEDPKKNLTSRKAGMKQYIEGMKT